MSAANGGEYRRAPNIVHLLVGAMGLASFARRDLTKVYGLALLVGYGATFV